MTPSRRTEWTLTPPTSAPLAPATSSEEPFDEDPPAAAIREAVFKDVPEGASGLSAWWRSITSACSKCGRGQLGEARHEHRSHREVGHHQAARSFVPPEPAQIGEPLLGKSGGPDHGPKPSPAPSAQVVHHHRRVGRLDHHVGLDLVGVGNHLQTGEGTAPTVRVVGAGELEVVGGLDCLGHCRGETAARPGDGDPYQAGPPSAADSTIRVPPSPGASRVPDLPQTAAVVVVGGGVTGASALYHLTAAGCQDVLLLERDTLCAGSTSKAAGGIRAQFSDELNIRMALENIRRFERFGDEIGVDIDFKQWGYLIMVGSGSLPQFRQALELQHRLGVPSELLGPDEIDRIVPQLATDDLAGATFCPIDGYATPESVAQGYASAATRRERG